MANLYGGNKDRLKHLTGRYLLPVYDPNFDEKKTKEYALKFFTLGSDFNNVEPWMEAFADDIIYIIADQDFHFGIDKVKEHLRSQLKMSPPLTYKFYSLFVKGNMSVMIFGNNLNDGNSFMLCGINFFDSDGKAFINIDLYNRFRAAMEVAHDLATQPKDAINVAKKFFN
jgi:hypothetical protein